MSERVGARSHSCSLLSWTESAWLPCGCSTAEVSGKVSCGSASSHIYLRSHLSKPRRCWDQKLTAIGFWLSSWLCEVFLLQMRCQVRYGSWLCSSPVLFYRPHSALHLSNCATGCWSISSPTGRTWGRFGRSQRLSAYQRLSCWSGCSGGKSHLPLKLCWSLASQGPSLRSNSLPRVSLLASCASQLCVTQVLISSLPAAWLNREVDLLLIFGSSWSQTILEFQVQRTSSTVEGLAPGYLAFLWYWEASHL